MCRSSWTNLKKDINIKGIVINYKEVQISVHADDALIFLNGKAITTERESLKISSKFYNHNNRIQNYIHKQ